MALDKKRFTHAGRAVLMGGLSLAVAGAMAVPVPVSPAPGAVRSAWAAEYGNDGEARLAADGSYTVVAKYIDAHDKNHNSKGKIRSRIIYSAKVVSEDWKSATVRLSLTGYYYATKVKGYHAAANQITQNTAIVATSRCAQHNTGTSDAWVKTQANPISKNFTVTKGASAQNVTFTFKGTIFDYGAKGNGDSGDKSVASGSVTVTIGAMGQDPDAVNQAAANAVQNRIYSLTTASTEAEIAAVRSAYWALTDVQKELVGDLTPLEDAEARVQEAKQKAEEAAEEARQEAEEAAEEARQKAEEAEEQARQAAEEARQKAEEAAEEARQEAEEAAEEARQKEAEDAEACAQALFVINDALSKTEPEESDVSSAKDAYRGLTADQRARIKSQAEPAIEAIQNLCDSINRTAAAVQHQITVLDSRSGESQVENARQAYYALSNYQMSLVDTSNLEAQEDRIVQEREAAEEKKAQDQEAADSVQDLVDDLAASSSPTSDDMSGVKEAYRALSRDQRLLVNGYSDAMKRAKSIVDERASQIDAVQRQIDALDGRSSADDVSAARTAYNALPSSAKESVDASNIDEVQQAIDDAAEEARQAEEETKQTEGESDAEAEEEVYEEDAPAGSYTVTVYANDGTARQLASFIWTIGQTYQLPAISDYGFSRDGYTFTGWNTQANGNGDDYSELQSVSDLTDVSGGKARLFAQWSADDGSDAVEASRTSVKAKPAKKKSKAKLSKKRVTLRKGKKKTVRVKGAAGKVSAKSSKKKVCKVSVKGKKVIVKGKKKGTATVTVKVRATSKYKGKTLKLQVRVK